MPVDAGVNRTGLRHFVSGREVLVDAVDTQRAWIVERHQEMLGRHVRAEVDGTRWQPYRLTVRRERAACRINTKRGDVMLGPGGPVP